jgi:hypothetical protein
MGNVRYKNLVIYDLGNFRYGELGYSYQTAVSDLSFVHSVKLSLLCLIYHYAIKE